MEITQVLLGDGFYPSILTYGKKPFEIANAENVSTKGTKNIMMMLGVVPIPTNLNGYKNFLSCLETRVNDGHAIAVYPEAHIWPYCTQIRNFASTSFKYPVKQNVPVFCFTTTYRKRKNGKVGVTIYVDGPFFRDDGKNNKENQELLRNKVYETMVQRSKNNTFEKIKYIKKGENIGDN